MTVELLNRDKFEAGDNVEMILPGGEHEECGLKKGVRTRVISVGPSYVELAIPASRNSIISFSYRVKLAPSGPIQGELFD